MRPGILSAVIENGYFFMAKQSTEKPGLNVINRSIEIAKPSWDEESGQGSTYTWWTGCGQSTTTDICQVGKVKFLDTFQYLTKIKT